MKKHNQGGRDQYFKLHIYIPAGLEMRDPSMVYGLHCRKAVDTSPPSKDLNF